MPAEINKHGVYSYIFSKLYTSFHRFIFEDYTPTNFDTFPAAIMTVFQVWKYMATYLTQ